MKTIIVTPTYNERKNVGGLVKKIFSINSDYHLLIIDDNSPDGTADFVVSLQESYSNLHLVRRPAKLGLGTAYCQGFKFALGKGFETIVQIDADLSHNPEDIPKMLNLLKGNDLILGSRYCNGVSVVRWPIRRLLLSYGANLYTRIVTGMPVQDATSGFKCWKRKALKAIDLNAVNAQGYSFQIEMTFRAWIKGFRIKEMPIIFFDRTLGESKMSRSVIFEAVWTVWKLRIWKSLGWIT